MSKNTITDYYRKEKKPSVELEAHVLVDCLNPMLNALKENEKEILQLTQLQEYSLKEVATRKDIALNTAKSQLFRAKKGFGISVLFLLRV